MKCCNLILTGLILFTFVSVSADDPKPVSLFNGKDLTGWKVDIPSLDKDPKGKSAFVVRDGMLVSLGLPRGHLITEKEYQNFRLEVEYRFPGNLGIVESWCTRQRLALFTKCFPSRLRFK